MRSLYNALRLLDVKLTTEDLLPRRNNSGFKLLNPGGCWQMV